MKFQKTKIAVASACLSLAGNPLLAQYNGFSNSYQPNESRASLGITIPFGGKAAESKPRVELSLQQFNSDQNNRNFGYQFQNDRINRDTRIGFSLTEKPQLMFNGKQFEIPKNQANISTGAAVLIGVVVVIGGIAVATTADAVDSLQDITDPD